MTKACAFCGVEFETRHTGERGGPRVQRFCSEQCSNASHRVNRSASCERCGQAFRPRFRENRRLTRFCSRHCATQSNGAMVDELGRPRSRTESETRDVLRARARSRYWGEMLPAGASGEYIRIRDLPDEWRPVADLVNQTRLAIKGHRRAKP